MTRELPRNIHRKGNRFYYVRTVAGKARWSPLSRDLDSSLQMAKAIRLGLPVPRHAGAPFRSLLRRRWTSARWRASRYCIAFAVTFEEILAMVEANGWRCAVTKLPFNTHKLGDRGSMPFSPSIDRIKAAQGYVAGNVRVICLAVNYALNEWGDETLRQIVMAMSGTRALKVALKNHDAERSPVAAS